MGTTDASGSEATLACLGADQRDEAIPLSGHCLYESRGLGVILQDLTKLPDRAPDAVVGIEENTLAPNPRDDFVPGNNLVPVLKQQEKDLQRDTLQLQHMTAAAQPPGTEVKLITFAEPDRLLLLRLARKPWHTPHGSGRILHHIRKHRRKCKAWFHLARHKT